MADNNTTRGWSIEAKLAYYTDTSPLGCRLWRGGKSAAGYGKTFHDGKCRYVHNVAWEVYRGPIPKGKHVLHNCPGGDDPSCWNPEHLWLGTKADNAADRDKKGRQAKGEVTGAAKLTNREVLAIRADHRLGCEIAAAYGLSASAVSDIKTGKSWRHLL